MRTILIANNEQEISYVGLWGYKLCSSTIGGLRLGLEELEKSISNCLCSPVLLFQYQIVATAFYGENLSMGNE